MDTQVSFNDYTMLKHSLSDFASFLRKNICFLHTRIDDSELAFSHYLCDELRMKIIKYKDVCCKESARRTMYSYFYALNKLKCDISLKSVPKFSLSYLNSILYRSGFARGLYARYNECLSELDEVTAREAVLLDVHDLKWTKEDVLIGSLRNREQLDFCLKHNFYHVPVHCIPDDKLPLNYIALYQSKNFYGEYGGINYYGKIVSGKMVDRGEIKEIPGKSTGKYYKIHIDKWIKLPKTIKISSAGSYFSYTNLYKLLRAQQTHELYFESEPETRFYYSLMNAVSKNNVSCTVGDSEFVISSGNILVYRENAQVYKISIDEFVENKSRTFNELKKYLR